MKVLDLLAVRAWLDLSQEKLAGLLGVSFASVNRWETGKSFPSGIVLETYRALNLIRGKSGAARAVLNPPVTRGLCLLFPIEINHE